MYCFTYIALFNGEGENAIDGDETSKLFQILRLNMPFCNNN